MPEKRTGSSGRGDGGELELSLRCVVSVSWLAALLIFLLPSEGAGQTSVRKSVARESLLGPDALMSFVQGSTTSRAALELVTARSILEPSREEWIARASRYDPEVERRLGAEYTPEGLARVGLGSAISPDWVSRLLGASLPSGATSLELSVSSTVGRSIDQASVPAGSATTAIQAATSGGEAFLRLRGRTSAGSYDFVLHRSVASDAQIRLIHQLCSD